MHLESIKKHFLSKRSDSDSEDDAETGSESKKSEGISESESTYNVMDKLLSKSDLPSMSSLPKSFDWRKEFDLPGTFDDLGEEIDQGECGDCYSFAATLSFQMRLRIAVWKKHKKKFPYSLSWRAAFQCTPFTEGCGGGFSYLTYKMFREVGVPLIAGDGKNSECDVNVYKRLAFVLANNTNTQGIEGKKLDSAKYATQEGANNEAKDASAIASGQLHPLSKEALDQGCKYDACYTGEIAKKQLIFASDYNYIGGFSQGATDEQIMQHIYRDGPVVVSMSVEAVGHQFFITEGKSVLGTDGHAVKLLKEPRPDNKKIRRWAALSHAVIAVGWGEEAVETYDVSGNAKTEVVPYWIVRNSWGKDWADGGYSKMVRGKNFAGVEYAAEYVIPDLDKMQKAGLI